MTEEGSLIRLFPVPFRAIRDEQKFKKWQWLSAQIYKAQEDRRPESHQIYIDTILLEDGPLPTTVRWAARRRMIDKLATLTAFDPLTTARASTGATSDIPRPTRIETGRAPRRERACE